VEDDLSLSAEMAAGLLRWGYAVHVPTQFEDVTREFAAFDPHLVLLDVNLPRYDGFWWCARIRELSKVPVIFVSSRDAQMDIVMAMNAGADDYITKPFSMAVLVAKVQAVLRRAYAWSGMSLDFVSRGGLVVNLSDSTARHMDNQVTLTRNEQKLLCHLLAQEGRVVGRDRLMELLWNDSVYVNDNTLTANMTRLRAKLGELGLPDFIETRKGQGYRIP
jgi:DNA-binding response OmpR family regulator